MPSFRRSRLTGLLFNIIALATSIASLARAQTTTVETASAAPTHDTVQQLDKYVVSATRTPQDPRNTPSAVTVIKLDELSVSQVSDLRTALAAQPGVVVVNTGATGGPSSIFMRGAASDQVLLFVDGVRMNTTEAGYTNFIGGADLVGIDRLEVLRGPQSTLYGSSAMGGVIALDTTHGCGVPTEAVTITTGSFDTFGVSASVQGGAKNFGYSASLARMQTDNDLQKNSYRQTSYSTRLELLATPSFLIGATLRGQLARYEEPGSITNSAGLVEAPNHLATTYAQWSPLATLRSRLTAAWHQTEYKWTDRTWGWSSNYYSRTTRRIVDWQNTWQPLSWVDVVAGADAEWGRFVDWSNYSNTGNVFQDDQKGIYTSAMVRPISGLTLDLGERTDDHNLEGRANTWRTGVSYYLNTTGTKFRATYGTGFKVPKMINRFGFPPYYGPNPTIRPETSKGWDAGLDQAFFAGCFTVSATYFHNDFKDLIAPSKTKPIYDNLSKAYTEGGEVAFLVQPNQFVKFRAAYTYLTAVDNSNSLNPIRLVRRPRHTGDVELQVLPDDSWVFGVGLHVVGDREDTDYSTYPAKQVDLENYAVARAFVAYKTAENVSLKFRVENALNESFFASIEWKF